MPEQFHFSGYATRNDLECFDGRVIRQDAFKEQDGKTVPMVWQHLHNSLDNVIGHAILENRDDGVYCQCSLNDTHGGKVAQEIIKHGDVCSLSIFANGIVQRGKEVVHGVIREVSLVLSGANPGAVIDNVVVQHDGYSEDVEEEAVITAGMQVEYGDVTHAAEDNSEGTASDSDTATTVADVYNSMTPEQQEVVAYMISQVAHDASENEDDTVVHSNENGETEMPISHNVFEGEQGEGTANNYTLSHSELEDLFTQATRVGSLRTAVENAAIAHGATEEDFGTFVSSNMHSISHGINGATQITGTKSSAYTDETNGVISMLFPEFHNLDTTPQTIAPLMDWVPAVFGAARKSPFSRLKTQAFDITADEARARGYVKGKRKIEEQIKALKRVVTPQTVYKLQKFDRDDLVDITDFDLVAWIRAEMRTMLDYEIARAMLIGDGRDITTENQHSANGEGSSKIDEERIIPIAYDNDVFAEHTVADFSAAEDDDAWATQFMDTVLVAMDAYRGSGNPTMFMGRAALTKLRMRRDKIGRRLYKNDQEIADELRVSRIVPIDLIDNQKRSEVEGYDGDLSLLAVIVNMSDYTLGANRGGQVTMFDDFDIDFNKYTYLIETRLCGMLTKPKSAIVIEDGKKTV